MELLREIIGDGMWTMHLLCVTSASLCFPCSSPISSTSIVEEGGSSYVNHSQLFETVVGSKEGHSYLRDEFITMSAVAGEQGTALLEAFEEHHAQQDEKTLTVSSSRPK